MVRVSHLTLVMFSDPVKLLSLLLGCGQLLLQILVASDESLEVFERHLLGRLCSVLDVLVLPNGFLCGCLICTGYDRPTTLTLFLLRMLRQLLAFLLPLQPL